MSVERNSQDNKNAGNNGAENGYVRTTGSFSARLKAVTVGRWIRFAVVSLLFFGWVVWLQNPWVLFAYPLLVDIYLTHYIPFTAWRGWKNNVARTIMGWVDAIVYALICCYFLFAFVGQQYQIPSSSLEKSLLVGDFLWVNKITYGPRVPNTPLHFPLAQNTLPILNC
ncbi:MAG: S26 family signal peptidase, partial [Bacteroidales bacterium]|nr:S26 family signal peptidase [Bacteroidales bacterium]